MNPEVLDKVLSCPRLPSLPAIAVKVIELTQNERVPVRVIGDTITNDQALSLKVLKTVNSSFYGLRKPCASINQAIVMLGMSAVKTLALGFSLVSSLAKDKAAGFDYESYWHRALISGVAGKCIAAEARCGADEEAFLGGLLQDVGMIALYQALGQEYADILKQANGEHRQLARLEMQQLEISHADIGAHLATRWKLPPMLIAPIKYHERPSAAPLEFATLCNIVSLANTCADLLAAKEPAVPLRRMYEKGQETLGLSLSQVDAIVKAVNQGSREIGRLLSVPTGDKVNVDELLGKAQGQLAAMALPFGGTGAGPCEPGELDRVTAIPNEIVFKRNLIAGFERSSKVNIPLSLSVLLIDGFDALLAEHGQATTDAVLCEVARLVRAPVESVGGILCRLESGRFAAVLPRLDRMGATRAIETARVLVHERPLHIALPGLLPFDLPVTLSAGIACYEEASRGKFAEPADLLSVTQAAAAAAAKAGSSIRVYAPKLAA